MASMIGNILQKIVQQLILLFVVGLVLLAAYVSIGRQFMPAISRYSGFLETQIFDATGIAVEVDSLTGSFTGFNPVIQINGLTIAVTDDRGDDEEPDNALDFERATIVVDIPRSIWQRRWVLEDFVIDSLELDIEQSATGAWQLSGLTPAGESPLDPNDLYQTFQRFTRLDLRNVVINVRTRTGEQFSFTNGLATIQNRNDDHYLHINTNLEGNPQQLAASLEVRGSQLDEISGDLHLQIPSADYSGLFNGQDMGMVGISEIMGGGEFWFSLSGGEFASASGEWEINSVSVALDEGSPLNLQRLAGRATVSRGLALDRWEVAFAGMEINYGDGFWRDFNGFVHVEPGQAVRVRADKLDLGLLASLALDSGLLDESGREQLAAYNPGGELLNLSFAMPLQEVSAESISLTTNLRGVKVGSVRGSPNMWGIDGYLEISFDTQNNHVTGQAEVESENFSMNIPNTFTSVWDYDYVNGRLRIDVDLNDGERVELSSSVIIAESEAVDGKAKFSSVVHSMPDGERTADLELMVGASRVEAERKSLYLPDGPNVSPGLRNSMAFLERGILGGDIVSSGIIFRGSTAGESLPVEKTFQSFWVLENGEFNFSDEWPQLESLSGLVLTNDNIIDIEVQRGESLGLAMGSATGRVRQDEDGLSFLRVSGQAAGRTSEGLAYMQAAPLEEGLKATFANWGAEGDFSADIEVVVPLNQGGAAPDIRLDIAVADNHLLVPDFDLDVSGLTGPIIFDTRLGLEPSRLEGRAFGDQVEINLSSVADAGDIQTITIDAAGRTTPEEMIAWPRQSTFIRDLLGHMSGDFAYQASMLIDQTGSEEQANRLLIDTSLVGAELDLPEPFQKPAEVAMPLHVELDFAEGSQQVSGTLGAELQYELNLENDVISSGLVLLGREMPQADLLSGSNIEGLIVLGEMERFDLQPWTDFIATMGTVGESSSDLGDNIAFVDINTASFSLYDQALPDVNFRIEPNAEAAGWLTSLSSDAVQGDVIIPYDAEEYLRVDLDYLRLPGEADADDAASLPETVDAESSAVVDEANVAVASTAEVIDEEEAERVDPLANLDPRDLPLMQFSTREFAIGDAQYGSWEFTLIPTALGAEFNDINFDFRGLRLGRDELEDSIETLEPHFSWYYDNGQHRSELTGVLVADDIGEVLAANGYAPSMASNRAIFVTEARWPGSPAFFAGAKLSGHIDLLVEEGRFNRNSSGQGALRLVSFINLTAVFQRLRFSDDLLRRGLAYDAITGSFSLDNGLMTIEDRLVISGPSSLYQITGEVDLDAETIEGEMYVTLPVSNNLPWIGLLTANIPLAVGAYLFDQIFGDQVDSLSSAVYTLSGPFEGLQPEFKQAFGSPGEAREAQPVTQ